MEIKEYKHNVVRREKKTTNEFLDLKERLFSCLEKLKLYSFDELVEQCSLEYLFNCLWDTYEDIREYSLQILIQLNVSLHFFDK